ncbi:MAG: prephenate dehydrogenase/arogenate dehydrogenase family protein [Roseiflexaceae bacterium]
MIRVAILGMGLIGTSIGMALRSADEREAPLGKIAVTGFDQDRRRTADARGRLAIDREASSIAEAVRDAALIVIAVPVQAMLEVLRAVANLAPSGAIITDVASTKAQVLAWAREILPTTLDFVGGHPMAGREKSGPGAADPDLFREAVYCLCPSPQARPESVAVVEAMVKQIGAKLYYIDPVEHDSYVAGVSHLPFLLSAQLVQALSKSPGWREMAPLAASGFRDMTRLASGDTLMHRDICMTNREALIRWTDAMIEQLLETRDQLAQGQGDAVLDLFEQARATREAWLESKPHMRPGEADFENPGNVQVERPNLLGRWGWQPGRK